MCTIVAGVVTGPLAQPGSAAPPSFVRSWDFPVAGEGEFFPQGIAAGPDGSVYIAGGVQVQRFTAGGEYLTGWGSEGEGPGQFSGANSVAVDAHGFVYVSDFFNYRIQKFTPAGEYVTQWGSWGRGDGQFVGINGVAVDAHGSVYVTDASSRVQKFTGEGQLLRQWGSAGGGDGQFRGAGAITIDGSGFVYVSDTTNRIQKFTPSGAFVTKWGRDGIYHGEFGAVTAIVADPLSGTVIVADFFNARLQEFRADGRFIRAWDLDGFGTDPTIVNGALGLAIGPEGNLYATMPHGDSPQVLTFADTPPPPSPTVGVGRPDLLVRYAANERYLGNALYNTDGYEQTDAPMVGGGTRWTFWIRIDQDGNRSEPIRFRGPAGNARFAVTYLSGGSNITTRVVNGTYVTAELDPGASAVIRVSVRTRPGLRWGNGLMLRFKASSTSGVARDVAKAFVW